MKPNWRLLAIAVPAAAALAALVFMLVAYQSGSQLSMPDMVLAAELGAGLGGLLTFTWPIRLLMR